MRVGLRRQHHERPILVALSLSRLSCQRSNRASLLLVVTTALEFWENLAERQLCFGGFAAVASNVVQRTDIDSSSSKATPSRIGQRVFNETFFGSIPACFKISCASVSILTCFLKR